MLRCRDGVALVVLAALIGGCSGLRASSPGATVAQITPAASPVPAVTTHPSSPSAPSGTAAATPTAAPSAFDDPLLGIALVDVRDGATFTLAQLATDAPVLVETMAIWCTNCRAQMHEISAAHELARFHSVSIDVDPTEIADDLVDYAAREGFDWRFALADAALATTLRERFGNEVLLPPGMPKLLVRTDGSVELLPIGVLLSAQQVADLVDG